MLTLTQSFSTLWAGLIAQDTLGLDVRQVALSMTAVGTAMSLLWLIFHLRNLEATVPAAEMGD